MMSRKKEKPNSDIDNVENMLQALEKVPGQIKDDSTIEISTEEQAKTTSDMTKIKLQELQVTIQLRKWWSILLLVLVGLIIISDGVITYLTGLGILNFTGISLPLFIGSNLAQIFALSIIIVKFLFNTNTD